jgi:hypothetical protein
MLLNNSCQPRFQRCPRNVDPKPWPSAPAGIRNVVGMDFHPDTGRLAFTNNEAGDELGGAWGRGV